MKIEMRKEDGTLSKSMIWNTAVMLGTSIFGVAITMLPAIEAIVAPPVFIAIALIVKGIDIYLRQITTQPMKDDSK